MRNISFFSNFSFSFDGIFMKFGHNIPEIKKNRDHFFEILIFGRSEGQKTKILVRGVSQKHFKNVKNKTNQNFGPYLFFLLISGILCPNFIKIPSKLNEEFNL